MRKEDIEIGMKVVPYQKTAYTHELEDSGVWKDARNKNQDYLYVIDWDHALNCFVLNDENMNDGDNGDFFNAEDFKPYNVSLKDKLLKLQQLYRKMMDLQYEINGEFHDRPISISQETNGSWNNDGFNLRINRVDIRTDDFGVNFDVIEDGEKIECVDGIAIDQFIKYGELVNSETIVTEGFPNS